jgi:hypothetical protein
LQYAIYVKKCISFCLSCLQLPETPLDQKTNSGDREMV